MTQPRREAMQMARSMKNFWFAVIVLAYVLYAGLFVYKTSFTVEGERYFSLFDDAMISMRYAKNFAHGDGLVWNPGGERVEGFSNPLWVFYMSLWHRLPISPSKMSLPIQLTGLLALALNLFFVRAIALRMSGGSFPVAMVAVLLTAFYLPLNTWGLQGMEVSVLTLAMSVAAWLALRCIREDRFSMGLYLLLGAGLLVRTDGFVPYLGFLVFLVAATRNSRRKHLWIGSLLWLAVMAGQTALRWWYYGEWLPNPYYLKMTGYSPWLRLGRGMLVFADFVNRSNSILFLLPFVALPFRRDRAARLLIWLFVVQALYSVYVGGDAWDWYGGSNRYISIAMPFFFVLLSCSVFRGGGILRDREILSARRVRWGTALFLALTFLSLNVKSVTASEPSPANLLGEWLCFKPSLHVKDNQHMVEKAMVVRRITTDEARIAVTWAGAIPYFAERPAIDLLGRSDKRIARGESRTASGKSFRFFHPGHSKWDFNYAVGEWKPDLMVQLWFKPAVRDIQPYLDRDYTELDDGMYARIGSPQIRWSAVDRVGDNSDDPSRAFRCADMWLLSNSVPCARTLPKPRDR